MLMGLGGLLVYLAFDPQIEALVWKSFTCVIGIACLEVARRLWLATDVSLDLSVEGLRDSNGRVLCSFDNIKTVDRGAFSFKPSNGLLIRLHRPMDSAWAPGLWWRYGTRLGIGGIIDAGQAKAMAEMISMRQLELAQAKAEAEAKVEAKTGAKTTKTGGGQDWGG
jgi:hypothetical protein